MGKYSWDVERRSWTTACVILASCYWLPDVRLHPQRTRFFAMVIVLCNLNGLVKQNVKVLKVNCTKFQANHLFWSGKCSLSSGKPPGLKSHVCHVMLSAVDLGSVLGGFFACFMVIDQSRATKLL